MGRCVLRRLVANLWPVRWLTDVHTHTLFCGVTPPKQPLLLHSLPCRMALRPPNTAHKIRGVAAMSESFQILCSTSKQIMRGIGTSLTTRLRRYVAARHAHFFKSGLPANAFQHRPSSLQLTAYRFTPQDVYFLTLMRLKDHCTLLH